MENATKTDNMDNTEETRLMLDEKIAVLKICGKFFLVPSDGPENLCPPVYIINETTYLLLHEMEQPRTIGQLADFLSTTFDGEKEQFLSDIEQIALMLLQKNYIRQV